MASVSWCFLVCVTTWWKREETMCTAAQTHGGLCSRTTCSCEKWFRLVSYDWFWDAHPHTSLFIDLFQREILHWHIHLPHGGNSRSWAELKPGPRNSVCHTAGSDPTVWINICCLPRSTVAGSWNWGHHHKFNPSTPKWDMGGPNSMSTSVSNAYMNINPVTQWLLMKPCLFTVPTVSALSHSKLTFQHEALGDKLCGNLTVSLRMTSHLCREV